RLTPSTRMALYVPGSGRPASAALALPLPHCRHRKNKEDKQQEAVQIGESSRSSYPCYSSVSLIARSVHNQAGCVNAVCLLLARTESELLLRVQVAGHRLRRIHGFGVVGDDAEPDGGPW